MTLSEIINAGGASAFIVAVMGVVIEITPIKINPVQWLGARLNAGINTRLDSMENEIKEIKEDMQERDALNARYRIIRFADELMHSPELLHSEEHFNQIEECITAYGRYCDKHPEFANHKARASIKRINEVYEKCRKLNNFLK